MSMGNKKNHKVSILSICACDEKIEECNLGTNG
jgi:hypothetical protein